METQVCSRCHDPKPLEEFAKNKLAKRGVNTTCKPCLREYGKEHYKQNKAAYSKRHKEYASTHRRESVKATLKWRERHLEEYKAAHREQAIKAYRLKKDDPEYRERAKKRAKEWYERNNEKLRLKYRANEIKNRNKAKEWRALNPDKVAELTAIARHRRLNIVGSFTAKEWMMLKKIYNSRCVCCGSSENLTVDHVIPVTKGGTGFITNIQPLCETCNKRKNARHIDYRVKHELSVEEVFAFIKNHCA